ncbi:MAG TPA: hypothetical protein VMM35_07180 [Longimicrobiales bacterium]|nr:hypothetical protein [Longimicrobiales bacterium]
MRRRPETGAEALVPGRLTLALTLLALGAAAPVRAQGVGDTPLSHAALRPSGQPVIPVYDGWFENPDASHTFCFGYFNLNTGQALDVPMGPGNRIEPARFDGAQPTHFDPVPDPELTSPYRHHWCVFTVTVPEDFGETDVWWYLATQGDTLSVPATLNAAYVLDEPTSPGRYAVAPHLRLEEDGRSVQGRRGVRAGPRRVAVGEPLALTAWVEHPEPGTWLGWAKHQGPGSVTFSAEELRVDAPMAAASTTATFETPGQYVLRVQAINDTEIRSNPTYGFEFHCCWTNGYVDVEVVEER